MSSYLISSSYKEITHSYSSFSTASPAVSEKLFDKTQVMLMWVLPGFTWKSDHHQREVETNKVFRNSGCVITQQNEVHLTFLIKVSIKSCFLFLFFFSKIVLSVKLVFKKMK